MKTWGSRGTEGLNPPHPQTNQALLGHSIIGHFTPWALYYLGTPLLGTSLLGHSTSLALHYFGTPLLWHTTWALHYFGHSTTWALHYWALHYLGHSTTWTLHGLFRVLSRTSCGFPCNSFLVHLIDDIVFVGHIATECCERWVGKCSIVILKISHLWHFHQSSVHSWGMFGFHIHNTLILGHVWFPHPTTHSFSGMFGFHIQQHIHSGACLVSTSNNNHSFWGMFGFHIQQHIHSRACLVSTSNNTLILGHVWFPHPTTH